MPSAYLKRDLSATGNQKKWTFSAWIKISDVMDNHNRFIFSANNEHSGGGNYTSLYISTDHYLRFYNYSGGGVINALATNRRLRDCSAWYHIMMHYDSANSTADDRIKFYINGVQETSMDTRTNPSQNYNSYIESGYRMFIGTQTDSTGSTSDFDGEMTHVHFANDQLYAPTVFGETDATTGIWKPKVSPSGVTYGTNGYFLKFDNSANMGLDSGGGSNNFTTSGTIIQNKNTPSNIFASLNRLAKPTSGGFNTFSNVNSEITNSADAFRTSFATLGVSKGKYYWEAKFLSGEMKQMIGISKPYDEMDYVGQSANSYGFQNENARRYNNGSQTSYGSTASSGDIIMVAFDATNGAIWVGKNGTWFNSATQSEIEAGTVTNAMYSSITMDDYFLPAFTVEDSNIQVNFGNGYFGTTAVSSAQNPDDGIGIFEYDVPAGYRALCTKSINAEEYS